VGVGFVLALSRAGHDADFAFAIILVTALLLSPLGWIHYLLLAAGPLAAHLAGQLSWAAKWRRVGTLTGLAAACLLIPYPLLVTLASLTPIQGAVVSLSTWGVGLLWAALLFSVPPTLPKGRER